MHQVIRPMDLLQMIMEFSLTWVHAGSDPTGLCTLAASLVACPAQCVRPNVQLGGYVVLNAVYHIPYIVLNAVYYIPYIVTGGAAKQLDARYPCLMIRLQVHQKHHCHMICKAFLNAVYHIPYIAPVLPCRELSECDAEQLA